MQVFKDNWIPWETCRRPLTPDLFQLGDISVANFLKPNGQGWNIDMLRCVFWDCDVEEIVQIPVSCLGAEDTQRWFYHKNGYYTVKSTYYAAREMKKQRVSSILASSSSNSLKKGWSFI